MSESEFGNVSWVYYVTGAYALVALALLGFIWGTLRRFTVASRALKEEGFSDDKS